MSENSLILLYPTLAQIITIGHPPPAICITAVVTVPTSCPTPIICPAIYSVDIKTFTQACTCASPIPTATTTAPCGTCPNCPGMTTLAPCTKGTPTIFCPVFTQTTGLGCTPPPGCVKPNCIALSAVEIPCGCTGIGTVRSCATTCPGGATEWVGAKETGCT